MSTAKKYYATRDFNDIGTEKLFTAGKVVEASDGAIANYLASGLVSEKAPETPKPAA